MRKKTIDDCHKVAKAKGGKCLSTKYVNGETPLSWRCEKEHTWKACYSYIKNRGYWCPKCAKAQLSQEDLPSRR
ncbi:hypothetical protein AB834_00075 [PVC group bacterium (ex Bugula neritina AB1)]|nr:hypothetical protein AB834_00075 [PVC group bacterium (ex Bugula neritina AB1)]